MRACTHTYMHVCIHACMLKSCTPAYHVYISNCLRPTRPRAHGCRDVWMYGFVGWLIGWLVDWLFGWLVGCKIHQVGRRKSLKLVIKTIKLEPQIVKNQSQKGSWRGLGGSWGALGLILAPRELQEPKKSPDGPPTDPPGPPKLGPKIGRKSILRRSKR